MRTIIYDFDGVLVDSVRIKQHAFFKLFQDEGKELAEMAYEYHIEDNRNRFQVVSYMASHLGMNKEYEDKKLKEFKNLVVSAVISAKEIPGADQFIKGCSFLNVRQFVVSGTPHGELREIIKNKRWSKYFTETFGTPAKKIQHNAYILSQYGISVKDVVFVGDMESDYRAASHCGFKFLARSDNGTFPVDKVPVIKDFTGLSAESVFKMVDEYEAS